MSGEGTAAAGELLAAPRVNHPVLGEITDPCEAYLVGVAEGMQRGWEEAWNTVEKLLTE